MPPRGEEPFAEAAMVETDEAQHTQLFFLFLKKSNNDTKIRLGKDNFSTKRHWKKILGARTGCILSGGTTHLVTVT